MAEGAAIRRAGGLADWWRKTRSNAGRLLEAVAPMLPSTTAAGSREMTVDGVRVVCDTAVPTDEAFALRWQSLFERVPGATAFQHPAWQSALMESAQALHRLRFFTVYHGTRLIAVAPLEIRFNECLRSCGTSLSDYLNPLIDPKFTTAAWTGLLAAIQKLEPSRPLVLENLDPQGLPQLSLAAALNAAAAEVSDTRADSVSRIALAATWEDYLAQFNSHDRKELKRKIRKAEEAGATFQVCHDPETIFAELGPVFELMHGAGGGKARKAKWVFPRHFASCAAALAKSGKLELCKLMIDGRPAAAVITLPTANGPILWNTGFDPAQRQLSPGIVLFGMIIRRAIEQKHTVVDLLRGSYDYKHRLGAVDHPLHTMTIESVDARVSSAA